MEKSRKLFHRLRADHIANENLITYNKPNKF